MDVSSTPPPCRLELDGEYDLARKDELRGLFARLDGSQAIEIDLTRVTYLDSTVLHELASLRQRCENVTLVGPGANVRRILEVTRLDGFFTIKS